MRPYKITFISSAGLPAGLGYRMVVLSNPLKSDLIQYTSIINLVLKKIQWYLRTRRNLLMLTTSLKKIFYNYKIRVRFLVVDPPAKFAKQKTQFSIGKSVVSPSAEVGPWLWKRCNNLFSKSFFLSNSWYFQQAYCSATNFLSTIWQHIATVSCV